MNHAPQWKTQLECRRKDLLKKVNDLRAYEAELEEVEKLLSTYEPDRSFCRGCPGGCDQCRTGPNYR